MFTISPPNTFLSKFKASSAFMKKKPINLEADFLDLIKLCNQYNVRYLVIDGYAVSIHGYPRFIKDLDICIQISEENADNMVKVINDFGLSSSIN